MLAKHPLFLSFEACVGPRLATMRLHEAFDSCCAWLVPEGTTCLRLLHPFRLAVATGVVTGSRAAGVTWRILAA